MPSIQTLLTDPDGFFRDQGTDPSLKGPIVVITLIAVVDALASVLQYRFMSQLFENMGVSGGMATAFQAFSFIFVLAGPFVVWILFAGLFQGISLVFDGDGDFSATLAHVGWGFIPSLFGSMAGVAVSYYRFNVRGMDVPAEMDPQAMQEFMQSMQTDPLVALTATLGIVFTLWSAFLWTFGLKHARNLSVKQAAITVALPVVIGMLIHGRSLLVALGVL